MNGSNRINPAGPSKGRCPRGRFFIAIVGSLAVILVLYRTSSSYSDTGVGYSIIKNDAELADLESFDHDTPLDSSIIVETREFSAPGNVDVKVVDENGNAVAGAWIYPANKSDRFVVASSSKHMRTGADGICSVSASNATSNSDGDVAHALMAYHPHFIPSMIPHPRGSGFVTVVLKSGRELRVNVTSASGSSLPGVEFGLSTHAQSLGPCQRPDYRDELPGFSFKDRELFSISDSRGQAIFRGLEDGLFMLVCKFESYIPLDTPFAQRIDTCRQGSVTVRLGAIHGVAVRAQADDVILGANVAGAPYGRVLSDWHVLQSLALREADYIAESGANFAKFLVPADDASAPIVPVVVMSRGAGIREMALQSVPIAQLVPSSLGPVESQGFSNVTTRVSGLNGQELEVPLIWSSRDNPLLRWTTTSGQGLELPPGEFTVGLKLSTTKEHHRLGHQNQTVFSLSGERISLTWELDREFKGMKFIVANEWNEPVSYSTIDLQAMDGPSITSMGSAHAPIWIPWPNEVKYSIVAPGYQPESGGLTESMIGNDKVVKIVLTSLEQSR